MNLTSHQNGILRFLIFFTDVTGGPRKQIYSGMEEKYDDRDPELKPWTEYQYMVEVFNSMGSYSSLWEKVRTDPAAPESVPAPEIKVCYINTID